MSSRKSFVAVVASVLAAGVVAQGAAPTWEERIADQWPGRSIAKVSEAEFRRFVGRVDAGEARAATSAFLRAQYAAYGLAFRPGLDFPVPSFRHDTWQPRPGLDAVVPEGPEPNGSPFGGGVPTALNLGDEGHGESTSGDPDCWSVLAPTTVDARIWVGPGAAAPVVTDATLTVFDAGGTMVAFNDDYHDGYPQVSFRMQAGAVYHAVVESQVGGPPAHYTVDFIASSVTGPPGTIFGRNVVQESAEPNDTTATATPISCDEIAVGTIGFLDDWDEYGPIIAPNGGMLLTVRVEPPLGTGGPLLASELFVHDTSFLSFYDQESGPGYLSKIDANVPQGSYFATVLGDSGVLTGDYSLHIECGPPLAIATEGPEPNEPFASPPGAATVIPENADVTGRLTTSSDEDWYRFFVSRGRLIEASTDGTAIALYDGAGDLLVEHDPGTFAQEGHIEHVVPTGSYYLAIRSSQGAAGAYRFMLVSRPGFGGVIYNSGGCPGSNGTPEILSRGPTFGPWAFDAPALGSTYTVDFRALPPHGIAAFGLGLSQTGFAGVPLPFDMEPLGASGCVVEASLDFVSPVVADALGDALWSIEVPALTALDGASFYGQAIVLDSGANGLGLTVSNSIECVIGGRLRLPQHGSR